jgi:Phage P22-like portal protein
MAPANSMTTIPDEMVGQRRRSIDLKGEGKAEDAGESADKDNDAEILSLARKRFQLSSTAESALRQEMMEDLRFRAGDQWPTQIRADRVNDSRPILTVNRIPQFIKQITNPQRQARPAIQVNPVGDGADKDTAEVIQGLIRHIEYNSHAEVAYDEAFEDAVTMGRGWFRILTEYVDDGTFEQEVVVKRVSNQFTVYPDPTAQELDYSDARFMFVVEDIPLDEFRELYGDANAKSLEMYQSVGDRQPDWFPEGKVRIAEYWYVEHRKRTIALIRGADGALLTVPADRVPEGTKIEQKREVFERVVHWIKMSASDVLERQVWPGKWIPIVPILGDEIDLNGRKDLVGIVRYARDPQRMYNFWVSAETEMIALSPRVPYIGAEGQFKGHESEWKVANRRNLPYLEYVPTSLAGTPIAAPQRTNYEAPIQAIVVATKQADNDLKSVIGFYDASLGERGPDQSGRAILARQKQGETANINFLDNYARALWHAGRIYLDLIPKIYDTARSIHIMREDDQMGSVTINSPFMQAGVQRMYSMGVGRYSVEIQVGGSWQTRRQEAAGAILEMVKAAPQLLPIIGDILVGEMDWPGANRLAARLKKALPPGLQDDDQDAIPPAVKAKMQQQDQMIQQQHQLLGKQKEIIDGKQMELQAKSRDLQAKIESDERRETLRAQAGIAEAALKAKFESDAVKFETLVERLSEVTEHLKDIKMQGNQHAHEASLAAADRAHEATQADADRQAEIRQAELEAEAAKNAPAGEAS